MASSSNSATDWLKLLAFAGGVSVTVFAVTRYVLSNSEGKVNPIIQKDSSKVVHSFDIEDLGDKAVYCRCWRSKKFPYCDGSHNKHNTCTGDNVGPLIIQKKSS